MCGIGSPSEPSTSHSQFLHIAASSHITSHRVYTRASPCTHARTHALTHSLTHARMHARTHVPLHAARFFPVSKGHTRRPYSDFSTNFSRSRSTVTRCATKREARSSIVRWSFQRFSFCGIIVSSCRVLLLFFRRVGYFTVDFFFGTAESNALGYKVSRFWVSEMTGITYVLVQFLENESA